MLKYFFIRSTPSAKYEGRSGKGDVLAAYGVSEHIGIEWKNTGAMPKVCLYEDDKDSLKKPYKHMFQKLQNKADGNYYIIINSIHRYIQ